MQRQSISLTLREDRQTSYDSFRLQAIDQEGMTNFYMKYAQNSKEVMDLALTLLDWITLDILKNIPETTPQLRYQIGSIRILLHDIESAISRDAEYQGALSGFGEGVKKTMQGKRPSSYTIPHYMEKFLPADGEEVLAFATLSPTRNNLKEAMQSLVKLKDIPLDRGSIDRVRKPSTLFSISSPKMSSIASAS